MQPSNKPSLFKKKINFFVALNQKYISKLREMVLNLKNQHFQLFLNILTIIKFDDLYKAKFINFDICSSFCEQNFFKIKKNYHLLNFNINFCSKSSKLFILLFIQNILLVLNSSYLLGNTYRYRYYLFTEQYFQYNYFQYNMSIQIDDT